ncbi:MAG: DUF1553 domain-containing protein [Rubripirellula sp.]|nr:DUF1553 domain-containing protein [Rubripirellula sp.]
MRTIVNRFLRLTVAFAIPVLSLLNWAFADEVLQFNRDVQPILGDRCYACHGPDEDSREADLRLDQRTSALGTNADGAAIVPGRPSLSELIHRINSDDPDEIMPPPSHNKPLSDSDKKVLSSWIAQGAKYERHWSFTPPRRSKLPMVGARDWPINPIDHFVLARLQEADFQPSAEAGRNTLVRRVTLDLTGLPPTPAEVDGFRQDTRKDAYERLVDRLMATQSYAERRAQDWLDLARYADTRGFADDKMRVMWPWRDWVIHAIDRNLPFDQFTVEQLAGDMLPGATDDQRLATGFHRNAPQAKGMTYPVEEYRIKGVIDRVNTIGRVWLGLTMDCAQCHDHKFDPITQQDYYSMLAIFNNIQHSGVGFGQGGPTMNYTPIASPKNLQLAEQRRRLEEELAEATENLPQPGQLDGSDVIGTWEGPEVVADPAKFSVVGDLTIVAKVRTTETVADIVSKYDWRAKQRSYVFGIGGEADAGSLPGHLFFWVSSRAESFSGVTVYSSLPVNDGREHHVAVEFAAGKSVRLFIDGIEDTMAKMTGSVPASIAISDRSLAVGSGYNGDPQSSDFKFKGELSGVQLSDRAVGDDLSIGGAGNQVAGLRMQLEKLDKTEAERTVIETVPVMRELAEPRPTFVHVRGDFLDRGEQVHPAVPAVFAVSGSYQPRNRLEFARWLMSDQNPLVARVVVNRFWQSYFGHGLVRTPDDFGVQGTIPTHPLLLDWLASEFVASGWDMKRINRLIVTSKTYRQSAQVSAESYKRDPTNRLLTQMPRIRLPAEQIRDQALAVSGLLTRAVGGPPVFPAQPADYWQQRVLPGKWLSSTGDDRYRRTMYTYWRRMALHPSMELLNAPARENCVVKRDVSNIPTQALVLLNDPIFTETAQAFAARIVHEVDSDDTKRLARMFRLLLARSPDQDEQRRFLAYIVRLGEDFNKDSVAARAVAGISGDVVAKEYAAECAAWTLACSVLLNSDEAITRP